MLDKNSMADPITHTVGNRELILGIDELYRDAMKPFEARELLPAAQKIANGLKQIVGDGPAEGYYGESAELTTYFQTMRALQQVGASELPRVAHLPEYDLLLKVTQSPIFGVIEDTSKIFPGSRDALYFALAGMPLEKWSVDALSTAAHDEAEARDDCSLVGLACLARDLVCITALRESAVLYAEVLFGAAQEQPIQAYEWAVEPLVEKAANAFIHGFNALVPGSILSACAENAGYFFRAYDSIYIAGRCVRIGSDDSTMPNRHYHWAVHEKSGEYAVESFWSDELWTTDRYRRKRH